MMNSKTQVGLDFGFGLAGSFLVLRIVLLISLPFEGLRGYGDLLNFYSLAGLGSPFYEIWVEFPPLFPWLSRALYLIGKGQEHVHGYALITIFTVAQSASILFFYRISALFEDEQVARMRGLIFAAISLVLVYGWWYFDSLAVMLMLLSVFFLAKGNNVSSAISIGTGALVKWFPFFTLPLAWLLRPRRDALMISIVAISLVFLVFGVLWLAGPEMTVASLLSQWNKGSWQTPWALLDRNFQTGNFGSYIERYDPFMAAQRVGNEALIPPLLTLPLFLLIGLWSFVRTERGLLRTAIAFLGLTWSLFLLWSPGWSPQWVLYLIPCFLLVLPLRTALILTANFVLVSLMEWPILLSRGRFDLLWIPVLIRTGLLLLSALEFGQLSSRNLPLTYEHGRAE